MKFNKPIFKMRKCLILIFGLLLLKINAQQKPFTIVIDPGHGTTNGAARFYSDLGEVREDQIVLGIALKLGDLLKHDKGIKVIFTRTTDVLPSLTYRTNLANNSNADLFISIHNNSGPKQSTDVQGTETYVQGPDQNKTNLDVAKRENSVIYLDKEDEKTFAHYDPNSPESLIALKLQQSKYLQKSLLFGSLVEKNFSKIGRISRGVKQQNLHVLRMNAMPSVLIETGFVNNHDEAAYMISQEGQMQLATAIYHAIKEYVKAVNRNFTEDDKPAVVEKEPELKDDYRIYLMSSAVRFSDNDPALRGLQYVLPIKDGLLYNYYYSVTNLASVRDANLARAKEAGFVKAVAVPFVPNAKLKNGTYTLELAVTDKRLDSNSNILQLLNNVKREKKNGKFYYTYGRTDTLESIVKIQKQLEEKGIQGTTIEIVRK